MGNCTRTSEARVAETVWPSSMQGPMARGVAGVAVPEAVSPCPSWQGTNCSLKPAGPDRRMHERHVQILEQFKSAVEHRPTELEQIVLQRRQRGEEAPFHKEKKRRQPEREHGR
ncbi:unnamed protein product [Effrenium voratum]|uniref:Uncharacterized protein n=1 Tax=Effrenium voratum TaxID=2562239 RepID=A0AA36J2P8_9DINO|nr:unnamed protein product [Effrenium voratum]CAJ1398126.1 unnamed protein product [Effrenium voratum]